MTERKKNWPEDTFTDEELIGYCRIHSQTQRALFHEMHVVRMLRMAGREDEARSIEEDGMGFYSIHEDEMEPIAAAADEYTYTNATVFKRDIICNPINFEELDEIFSLFVENGPVIHFRHFQQVLSFLLESDILPDDLNGLMNSLVISKVMGT